MTPYFILLPLVLFLAYMAKKTNNKISYKIIIFSIFFLLVLFAGLRDQSVGTDTSNYVRIFQHDRVVNENIFETSGSMEIGYLFLQRTARLFSDEYWVLLTLIAALVVYFYLSTILKLSGNYFISIMVFISLGTYMFFFNGARQGIAAAIFSFAIIAVVERDYKKYYLWTFIAVLFHNSVLITLPFYFLLKQKYSFKNLLILIGSLAVIVFLFYNLLSFLPEQMYDRYSVYEDRGKKGGLFLTIFYIIMLSFFIFMRTLISKNQRNIYDVYLNMTIIFTLIFVAVSVFSQDVNLFRLALYFSLGSILIWPMIFKAISGQIKYILFLFFVIGHISFFYIYANKMANLIPHTFNL